MVEAFLYEEMMRDLWTQFWVGLSFIGFFLFMAFRFPNSNLAGFFPFGILMGFLAAMHAVIQFAGGFTSFLGILLTVVSIAAAITTVMVNLKKLTSRNPADGAKRGKRRPK